MAERLNIQLKRIYEIPEEEDGYRILVDRLWPRGIKNEYARLDEWNKALAPSTHLRKWFHQHNGTFDEFSECYRRELLHQEAELTRVKKISETKRVTLLYASKEPVQNHAVILYDTLRNLWK